MGHILSDHGIKADQAKVDAAETAPTPRTVSEVKRFLGLRNSGGTIAHAD